MLKILMWWWVAFTQRPSGRLSRFDPGVGCTASVLYSSNCSLHCSLRFVFKQLQFVIKQLQFAVKQLQFALTSCSARRALRGGKRKEKKKKGKKEEGKSSAKKEFLRGKYGFCKGAFYLVSTIWGFVPLRRRAMAA